MAIAGQVISWWNARSVLWQPPEDEIRGREQHKQNRVMIYYRHRSSCDGRDFNNPILRQQGVVDWMVQR